ncbi:MAG: hypothetical protein WC768_00725 [Patescibacteria group bacterium]|jgi:hypothetical protein
MDITIDFSGIPTNDPIAFTWWFFKTIGWIYPVFLFCYGLILFYQLEIRNKYRQTRKYILLAVDVPKDNELGPKGVENIFNQLAGAHQPLKTKEKWWTGEIPDSFSFEIVSIGGYIQFVIHFVEEYRDLIEAIIYAQYPDAEITEIEDYTKDMNIKFPSDKYDLWGAELKLAKKEFYPIRTYPEFEHVVDGFLDSMSGLLEALTRIGPGEQIWTQLIVTPADNDWGEGAENLIKKLSGGKPNTKKSLLSKLGLENLFSEFDKQIFGAPEGTTAKKDEPYNLMMNLTPGEKDSIGAIEKKVAKLGFHVKIRLIYLAEKAKMNKPVAKALYGAYKQFNTLDLNSLKPDGKTFTGGIFWFKERRLIHRKNKILYRYKNRGHWLEPGHYGQIMNSEELASVYHFPVMTVKAPLVKKTEAKKAEPPMSLPVNQGFLPSKNQPNQAAKAGPPDNLPIG